MLCKCCKVLFVFSQVSVNDFSHATDPNSESYPGGMKWSCSRTQQTEKSIEMTTIQTVCLAAFTVAAPFCNIASGQGLAEKSSSTVYPIEHLVVIFQENISFDHYFATYPVAANPPGEPPFVPKPGTPTVNGLTPDLLTRNQNSLQPTRLN